MIGGGVFNTPDEGEVEEEELEEKKPVKKEIVKSKKKKYTKGTTTKLKDSDMDGYVKKVEDRKKKPTKENMMIKQIKQIKHYNLQNSKK